MEITARPRRRRWRRALGTVLTTAALASVVLLVPAALGYGAHVVGDRAMAAAGAGDLARGSVVFDRREPVGELVVGDVVTFVPPGGLERVTRRVVTVSDGLLTTRGDAVDTPDPWLVPERTVERVAFSVPWLGWPLLAVDSMSLPPWLPAGVALGTAGVLLWLRRSGREVREVVAAVSDGVAVTPPGHPRG